MNWCVGEMPYVSLIYQILISKLSILKLRDSYFREFIYTLFYGGKIGHKLRLLYAGMSSLVVYSLIPRPY